MKLIAIALFAIALSHAADEAKYELETYVFTESYRSFRNGNRVDDETYVLWGQRSFSKRTGGFVWVQATKSWGQAYTGGYVKPFTWLQVGAGGGLESAGMAPRLGTWAYVSKDKFMTYAVYENSTKGGSGYWYLVITGYDLNRRFNVGSHSQAFIGHGPRVEVKLGKIGNWVPSLRPAILWNDFKGAAPDGAVLGFRMTYFASR